MAMFLSYFVALLALLLVSSTTLQLATKLSTQYSIKLVNINMHHQDWSSVLWAFLWDLSLIIIFVVQHSLMATNWWKDIIQDLGMRVVSRALYAIATAICLQVLMQYWVVLPAAPVWYLDTADRPLLYLFFWLLHLAMWMLLFGATLTMDLPELVGIKQVYYADQGFDSPMTYKSLEVRRLYRNMRHAGVWCMLVILWVHPAMTLDRWALATVWTIYLLLWFSVKPRDYIYVETQYNMKHRSHVQVTQTEYYQR